MACQGRFDFPPAYVGDTWDGIPLFRVLVNGVAPTSPLSLVRIKIVNPANNAVLVHLVSGSPGAGETTGITIVNAANWEFRVNAINRITYAPGTYSFDIETTAVDTVRKTYVVGNWVIRPEK